jgi:hypothetical protein
MDQALNELTFLTLERGKSGTGNKAQGITIANHDYRKGKGKEKLNQKRRYTKKRGKTQARTQKRKRRTT